MRRCVQYKPVDVSDPEIFARMGHAVNGIAPDALRGCTVKITWSSLVQPAMLVILVLFWSLGPTAWVNDPRSIIIAIVVTLITVLALEWISERHVSWRWTWREVFTDVFYVVLSFTVIDWFTTHLAENPLTTIKTALHISTPWAARLPFVVQAAMVFVLIEFGQYWMHRAMHAIYPLWLTHAPHHHITQLNALKGYVGNPIELFLISLSVVGLFDFSLPAVFCAANLLGVVSAFAHANVRLDTPRWYAYLFTTIEHHSLHHSVPYEDTLCNYGNSLILLDRVFGTFKQGEAEAVGQDERKRLSIREQFAFPFVPLVAKLKARRGPSATA